MTLEKVTCVFAADREEKNFLGNGKEEQGIKLIEW